VGLQFENTGFQKRRYQDPELHLSGSRASFGARLATPGQHAGKVRRVASAFSFCRLSKVDQERVFPNSVTFDSPKDQEAFVREWAQKRTGLACDFKVCLCSRAHRLHQQTHAKI
jgi:hypothetical protein